MAKKKRGVNIYQPNSYKLIISFGLVVVMEYLVLRLKVFGGETKLLMAALTVIPLFVMAYVAVSMVMRPK